MNLDYVMFGVFGVPLYREHTCFEDGDYCDFKLKMTATTATLSSKWTQSLWNTGRRSLHRARDTNKEKVLQCQDMRR